MNDARTLRLICILTASLIAAPLLSGCAEDSESGPTLAGIYTVNSHTLNPTRCDAPGPAVSQPDVMFFAHLQSFSIGSNSATFMQLLGCADLASCRALKAEQDPNTISFGSSNIFDKGNGTAGWTGSDTVTTQGGATSSCDATFTARTFAAIPPSADAPADAPARVRVETRTWKTTLPPGPDDPNKFGPNCPDDNLEAEAKKNPCVSLEVIEATLVE